MASVGETVGAAKEGVEESAIGHTAVPKNIQNDTQNDGRKLADLWNAALKSYKGVVGFDLTPRAANLDGLRAIGDADLKRLQSSRHDGGKIDRLRGLFSKHLNLLDKGSQKLADATSSSFPPATIIGSAVTWMLSACSKVSRDYDALELFFSDMNSFLERVAILENRMRKEKGLQRNGRFRTWVTKLLQGDDSELDKARQELVQKLDNFHKAIVYAILLGDDDLRQMRDELHRNEENHRQMLVDQTAMLHDLQAGQDAIKADLARLLKAVESPQKDVLTKVQAKATSKAAGRIKIIEYHNLKETIIDGTCTWLFSQPEWLVWAGEGDVGISDASPKLLAIIGEPGSGKSHIAAAVYDHLEQLAGDPERRPCAAHFYFREQNPGLAEFRNAVITAINLVAEQNPSLCERLYAQIVRDDVIVDMRDWRSLLRDLLQPCFEAETHYRLFLVLDSIDELGRDERAELCEFWRAIVDDDLRISLIVTSRPDIFEQTFGDDPASSVATIRVTRELQKSDIAAIVRNQLGNLVSLKRFRPYVKQQISEKIEARAPNPLYAHHMLRYFDTIGREGAVLGQLKKAPPETLYDLYEMMLTACMRRTVDKHHDIVGVLFCWLAFSSRPLILDEVVSLLRHASGDDTLDLDDFAEPMMLFVRIGDPGRGSELVHTSEVDYLLTGDVGDPVYEDGGLPIQFRQRAMRSFFCDAAAYAKSEASRRLLISPSEAHRRIFLAASRMSRLTPEPSATTINCSITYYSALYLVFHWMGIDHRQHSPEQRAEIMETLASVMSNEHGYSRMAQKVGLDYEGTFSDDVLERMRSWASGMTGENGVQLSDQAASWWERVAHHPAHGLIELAKGHVRDVYEALSAWEAEGAYYCAIAALLRSGQEDKICKQAARNFSSLAGYHELANDRAVITDQDGILGLAGLFDDVPMTCDAYWSIAWLLLRMGHPGPARLTCETGMSCEPDAIETFRFLWLEVQAELDSNRPQEAVHIISERLNPVDTQNIPEPLRRWAHVIRARVYASLGDRAVAAVAFSEGRALDNGRSMGGILNEEATIYIDANDYIGFVDVVRSWSPIERFAWLISDDSTGIRYLWLHRAAALAGQREYLVDVYEEVIAQLDRFEAAAPLRCDLAAVHLLVCNNPVDARRVLYEVLNDHSDGQIYKFTSGDPRTALVRAVSLQSRALWDLFVLSRNPADKAILLEEARGLTKRPLASSVSSFSTTDTLYHEIMVARMTLQMGPRLDFQIGIQRVVNACFDTLEDNVGWNDGRSLWLLSQALTHLSKAVGGTSLRDAACVLISAYFNILETFAGTEDGSVGQESVLEEPTDDESAREETTEDQSAREKVTEDESVQEKTSKDVQRDGDCEPETEIVEHHIDAATDGSGPSSANTESDQAQEAMTGSTELIGDCEGGGGDDQVGGPTDAPVLPDNEGDLNGSSFCCDGTSCHPRVDFNGKGGTPMYVCVDCDWTAFCEDCFQVLKARDSTTPFCGRGHNHIKAPMDGWRGVKNGIMRIEGREDVPFKEFLRSVRELCNDAWDEFWSPTK